MNSTLDLYQQIESIIKSPRNMTTIEQEIATKLLGRNCSWNCSGCRAGCLSEIKRNYDSGKYN